MSTKYFALLTHAGTSKLENAVTSGTKLEITHMAVGDGGGSLPVPNVNQSKLINEKHRAEIDVLTIDPKKTNQIIAEQVLPEGQGGWWIREIGLFDKDGTLVAVGNCADLYKPQLQEQTVSMALPVSNSDWTGWVNELFSGLATRNYVREKIKDHAESRNHPDATLKEKGLVTLSNAVDSDNETHAATSKAVRTTYALATKAYDLANITKPTDKWVPLTRKVNGKELKEDIVLNAADLDTYKKDEIDQKVGKVDALAETANKNATSAIQSADSKVPLTRKVNGKELLTDIELTALDVNAYNRPETDELIGIVKKQSDTANQNATAALQSADSKVPLTRKVNNKELLTDIDLNAADVGTYNKSEIDAHINKVEQLADTANKNATSAIQNADSKVPLTRKVNGKELLTDIELNATDIGTYNKVEINEHISKVEKLAETANHNATTAIQSADNKVPLTRKVNGKELLTDIELSAADVGAYNKVETDDHINNVKTQVDNVNKLAETANQNATTAIQSADSKVPLTRKVNGKELLTDIELSSADIGTYNRTEIDDRINKVDKLADTANQNATSAIQNADSKVPLIRKVNGKELSTDIQLIADDVGAYNKKETDDRINIVDKLADTANKNAISAIQNVDSKVPLTRKVNGKELSTDIELTATDIDVYNKADVNILFEDAKELANNANNNADNKVPLTRTVNGKSLLTDIKLQASDLNVYSKGEADSRIEDVKELANNANNNADSRVPLTRTVNGKALLSDIKLIASDVGAYTKAETDLRISKVEDLAKSANNNASGRLEKGQNGADIPDKKAFVKNLGLSDLIGLGIESRRVGTDVTIIKLGDIIKINGLAVANEPIGEVNSFVIGGVTYYTHYYKIQLPISLPNGIISCHASIVGNNFDNQQPGYLADVKTQRNNPNGVGVSKDTLTISVTTPQVGWVPHFDYQVIGY
ncbi:hypothetical protein XBO1_600027 [Xenorhabdus bovienii str. oregonense]|uniref:Phage tail fibre protein N-terminal domain-containing protein n=1 Tax=Xenorhabdus bovienii str. oregonense TaxID=1398202 RepID=A0A077P9Q6_XENBV|nr:phage tail protein [Xenorhabdus bovienii]CDH07800.1 hypothetical protein XBO1_600027 [Xenorhabdus bovienii str. oregonense]